MIIDKNVPASPVKATKAAPLLVTLKDRYALTKAGSTKQTYHVTLDLRGAPLDFAVGDSIGVFAQNDPELVAHLLDAMRANGDELIVNPRTQESLTVRDFLTHKANLAQLTSSFLRLFSAENAQLAHLLQKENKTQLAEYLKAHDPLDLLKEYQHVHAPLQELCAQFGPLLPRFYSIASSPKMSPDEIHLTVGLTTFQRSGPRKYGVASHFLCHLAEINLTEVPIYVQPAHAFGLAQDPQAPVIMIGPGTGVAPFRAFLQERQALGHAGKNWLFFGERHRQTDYFYEEFWSREVQQGRLRLDLAFSRDQTEKVYVQHKMAENAADLWQWIQEGAYIYVCGDAERMSKDVDAMLHNIVQTHGKLSPEEAKAFLKGLRTQKRYLFDVY